MSAQVTDQFRISNAGNFVDSVLDTNNSYYVFLGLSNPTDPNPGFGRTSDWDSNKPLDPIDNLQYEGFYKSAALFGKKINSTNIRRVIRKVQWTANTPYDMYRQDYKIDAKSPNSQSARLYDTNYYVVNSDFNVYICIDNGSSGAWQNKTLLDANPSGKGGTSKDEPTFTDLEPSAAGDDGYIWKFLFSISPSDIIKFDSTEYIVVPNDWATSTNSQIQSVRESGNSEINLNQIKQVYIENGGAGYQPNATLTVPILGDGTGGRVSITTTSGVITKTVVTSGGTGYTYGIVDLSTLQTSGFTAAKLVPIIPPSRGHGYDIYKELGADRVLVYSRFDDSTKDFPTATKFSQVGIVKNPSTYSSRDSIFTGNQYSALGAIKFDPSTFTTSQSNALTGTAIGSTFTQTNPATNDVAQGYVASYDKETGVLKYTQDRSLYFGNKLDQTDYTGIATYSKSSPFRGSADGLVFQDPSISGNKGIQTSFSGITTTIDTSKQIDLGVEFTDGLADPEINKTTGDVIYIDNRKLVTRDSRQKEDIKLILEF